MRDLRDEQIVAAAVEVEFEVREVVDDLEGGAQLGDRALRARQQHGIDRRLQQTRRDEGELEQGAAADAVDLLDHLIGLHHAVHAAFLAAFERANRGHPRQQLLLELRSGRGRD